MGNVSVVIFEVPSLWGTGAQTPVQAADRVVRQLRQYDLHSGFWTVSTLPRPVRDTRTDRIAVSLIGEDRPREEGRSVTIELRVEAQGHAEAVEAAYAQLHDAARGPWDFVVKYSGTSHAVAIPVTAGAPAAVTSEQVLVEA